jgi:hypothetical protein
MRRILRTQPTPSPKPAYIAPRNPAGAARAARLRPTDPVSLLTRLTPRDHTLLRLLAEHRVLTTEHITNLLFPNQDRAQRRLVTLYRFGALDRFRSPRDDSGTLTSYRYTLGPAGAVMIAATRGTKPPHPSTLTAQLTRLATHPGLGHLLGVHDLLTALAAYARTHRDHQLAVWWGERHAADACGHLIRPDALALWRHPKGEIVLAVEHDTGSETLHRVAAKLTGYHDLAAAGGPQIEQSTTRGFTVAFHLSNLAREARLRPLLTAQLADTAATGGVPITVATSTTDYTQELGPAGEVWLPLRANRRHRLEELTTR